MEIALQAETLQRRHIGETSRIPVRIKYRIQVCSTEASLYHRILACSAEYQFELQHTSLYYRVPVCATEYWFLLQSSSL